MRFPWQRTERGESGPASIAFCSWYDLCSPGHYENVKIAKADNGKLHIIVFYVQVGIYSLALGRVLKNTYVVWFR